MSTAEGSSKVEAAGSREISIFGGPCGGYGRGSSVLKGLRGGLCPRRFFARKRAIQSLRQNLSDIKSDFVPHARPARLRSFWRSLRNEISCCDSSSQSV